MIRFLMSLPRRGMAELREAAGRVGRVFSSTVSRPRRRSNLISTGRLPRAFALAMTLSILVSCAPVDLNAPLPTFDTGIDPNAWAQIPAGEFYYGQHDDIESTHAYEIMVTDVTVGQYADFLNAAQAEGAVKIVNNEIVGYYPGDIFRGVKHEE